MPRRKTLPSRSKRTCHRCGVRQPIGQFLEMPNLAGGRSPWCQRCTNSLQSNPTRAAVGAYRRDWRKLYMQAYMARKRPPRTVHLQCEYGTMVVRPSGRFSLETTLQTVAEAVDWLYGMGIVDLAIAGRGCRSSMPTVVKGVGVAEKLVEATTRLGV